MPVHLDSFPATSSRVAKEANTILTGIQLVGATGHKNDVFTDTGNPIMD